MPTAGQWRIIGCGGSQSFSIRTVKAHLSAIFDKMGVALRTAAIVKGVKQGLLTVEELSDKESTD